MGGSSRAFSPGWPLLVLLAGCPAPTDDETEDTDVTSQAELLGIGLSPREPVLVVGSHVDFQVRAFYDDTTTRDVTAEVTWVSTEPRVATVDASGRATALAAGEAGIVATDARGVATRTSLLVRGDADAPTALELVPRSVQIRVDEQVELKALGTFADGSSGNLASDCSWSVDDASVAGVVSGNLRGLAEGRTTVRAECGTLSAAAPVSVEARGAELDLPDLVITDVLVESYDADLLALVEIENRGQGMSPVGFVDLFLDGDGAPESGDAAVETAIFEAIAPGDVAYALVETADVLPGAHDAWFVVDADEDIEESDDGNNVSGPHPFEIGGGDGPELVIETFEGLTDGVDTFYFVEIRNNGDAPARDFWVDLWLDPGTDPGICEDGDSFEYVTRLAPGEAYVWEPYFPDAPSSSWLSVLFVDSCDDVVESDESDNLEYAWVEP